MYKVIESIYTDNCNSSKLLFLAYTAPNNMAKLIGAKPPGLFTESLNLPLCLLTLLFFLPHS